MVFVQVQAVFVAGCLVDTLVPFADFGQAFAAVSSILEIQVVLELAWPFALVAAEVHLILENLAALE